MFSSTELVSRASSQDVRPVAGHRGRGRAMAGVGAWWGEHVGQAASVQGLEKESNL